MDFGYLWKNLKFNARNAMYGSGYGLNWRIQKDNSPIQFKNQRYKSVAVHSAKQLAMSELEGEWHKIVPRFRKHLDQKMLEHVRDQQQRNKETLIKNQEKQSENWGSIRAEGGHIIVAQNKYGDKIKEALMLYYDLEEPVETTSVKWTTVRAGGTEKRVGVTESYKTKTMCHIDLSPSVSMNSNKNIVMTQVQGRDYTRKELVSGGDLQFSVSGNIVSEEMGVYPKEAVRKFIKMMQYNGILNVNFMLFEPFNVNRIIIKDYSLGQQTYKNIQPYTFNCVAVEPDDEIIIKKDTISILNEELQLSPMNKWYNLILNNKLAEVALTSTVNTVASASIAVTGASLDKLTTNI